MTTYNDTDTIPVATLVTAVIHAVEPVPGTGPSDTDLALIVASYLDSAAVSVGTLAGDLTGAYNITITGAIPAAAGDVSAGALKAQLLNAIAVYNANHAWSIVSPTFGALSSGDQGGSGSIGDAVTGVVSGAGNVINGVGTALSGLGQNVGLIAVAVIAVIAFMLYRDASTTTA